MDDIDAENFSLGIGPMKMKKDRLDRFVGKLVDDDLLRKKFHKSRKSRDKPEVAYPTIFEGNNLHQIDKLFTPGQDDDPELEVIRKGNSYHLQPFMAKNLNIAPFFKEYME